MLHATNVHVGSVSLLLRTTSNLCSMLLVCCFPLTSLKVPLSALSSTLITCVIVHHVFYFAAHHFNEYLRSFHVSSLILSGNAMCIFMKYVQMIQYNR